MTTAFDSTPAADPSDDVEALRAAKKYAESIIESVREPLLVLTPDLRVKTANPAFCRHFQVNEADILGTPVLEMGGGQWDIPALRSLLDDVLPEDHTFEEFEVRHDFGTLGPRVLLLNARRLDHVRLILLGIRDITEETRTKERLAEKEEQYRTALKNSPVVFARIDPALRYEWIFNPHRDFDPTTVEGKRDDELGAGPGIDALMALKRRVFDTAEQDRQEIVFARSDGNHTYDVTATPITDEEGRVRHVLTASLDITERSRTEEALRHSEELYRALFDSMDMGFYVIEVCFDESGRPNDLLYRNANPAAARMVGEDYTGRYLSEIDPDFEPHWYEIFGRVAETGDAVRMEQYAGPLDAWYGFHVFRIGGAESRLIGNIFEDITERKRAADAREEAERELERRVEEGTREVRELAETLAVAEQQERQRLSYLLHDDIQQLLYSIQMKLYIARQEMGRENLEQIRAATDRSIELLEKAIRRTRQLTVDLNPPILDGADLLEAVDWLKSHMLELHGLAVDIRTHGEISIKIPERRILLFQITRELLFNVAQHAGTSRADVEIRGDDGWVRVVVSDEGTGFDAERVLSTRGKRGGLGLRGARERLRMHGGDLEIQTLLGGGVTVIAYVPVA